MADRNFCLCLLLLNVVYFSCIGAEFLDIRANNLHETHVHHMINSDELSSNHRIKRQAAYRHKRDVEDATCKMQEKTFLSKLSGKEDKMAHEYAFSNETKYSMALAWAGENNGVIIMVTTEEFLFFAKPSNVYQSVDDGKTFTDINSRIDNAYIRKGNGLQKHPLHSKRLYLVAHTTSDHTDMWLSDDGGMNFKQLKLPFLLQDNLIFHPSTDHLDWMLASDVATKKLYITKDAGVTWKLIRENAMHAKWSSASYDSTSTIYLSTLNTSIMAAFFGNSDIQLERTTDLGESWAVIHDNIFNFGLQGKFLYVSARTKTDKNQRLLEVSTDGGKRWNEAQLPVITSDRFYSILDMSEGLIFVHVDNPGDTGHGSLYASDATGVIFSESLTQHLYPNFHDVTDFYRVRSMRAVYLASQMSDDRSIHTVITFNRGATWQPVARPTGAPCKDESKACYLQIHNMFSAQNRVRGQLPLSTENAIGIVLVHGHVADALQTTPPDVYVTSDGGYTWIKALDGPHFYQIADQGGLLVATPMTEDGTSVIKFSTDEGRCWHEYHFAKSPLILTGLLTEPGSKAMSAAIWGYMKEDRRWRVHSFDFTQVVDVKCYDVDYEKWIAHFDNSDKSKFKGCVLGIRETFMRLKKDSWCANGHTREVKKSGKQDICECMKDDYDCDYSYHRKARSQVCVKDDKFKGDDIDICMRGHEEKVVTVGYHKIPGDKCKNGFQPAGEKLVDLKQKCVEGDKSLVIDETGGPTKIVKPTSGSPSWIPSLVVVVTFIVILALFVACRVRYKMSRRGVTMFKYSSLKSSEEDDARQPLTANTSLFDDSDDEQVAIKSNGQTTVQMPTQNGHAPTSSNAKAKAKRQSPTPPAVKSYHDDSDVDMIE